MAPPDHYVHGYSQREAERLLDQAVGVRELLHHDTHFPPGSRVLEAGCGVGAQTVTLARQSPGAAIVSIDIAPESLAKAQELVSSAGLENVTFRQADIFSLPFEAESFDHVFVCYVLEHLSRPCEALACLRRVLKPGGTMTVIEGDHGSCYFHPETADALTAWRSLIDAQAALGGNSLIGRELYPLLVGAGLEEVQVSPRLVYCDQSRPEWMESFVRRTIIPMVEGAQGKVRELGIADSAACERGLDDLRRLADAPAGTFLYTFFKATGRKGIG